MNTSATVTDLVFSPFSVHQSLGPTTWSIQRIVIAVATGSNLPNILRQMDIVDLHFLWFYAKNFCGPGNWWYETLKPLIDNALAARRMKATRPAKGRTLVQKIKAVVSVEAFASRFTTLQPTGVDRLTGLCPLHEERTASFTVFTDSDRWRCFGACKEGGDVITLAQRLMDGGVYR